MEKSNLGSPDQDSFAIGLVDDIGVGLSRLEGLQVTSSFSARQYAGGDTTIQQMGEELDVMYALVGSVRYAPGERIRITPQLVRVSDEMQVWSETYDRVLSVDDLQRASGGLDGVAATPKPQTEPLDQSDLQRASGAAHSASTTDGLPSAGGSFRPTFEGDIVDGDEPRDISPI